jgi:hypothetical protein
MLAQTGPSRELVRSPEPDYTVTSLSSIGMSPRLYIGQDIWMSSHVPLCLANNIDMAIRACAPERSDLLRNREEMQIVLESLDEGYCYVTRKTRDLELVVVGMYPLVT